MRSVRMDSNGPPTKRLVELNRHSIQDGQNGVRGGITGDGQGLSEEDESRINEDVEGGNETQRNLVQVQAVLQTQQQQPPGPLVRWERFLPLRSLKVLLVENDDSTRHVVSALLRNCSYEDETVQRSFPFIHLATLYSPTPWITWYLSLLDFYDQVARDHFPDVLDGFADSPIIPAFNCFLYSQSYPMELLVHKAIQSTSRILLFYNLGSSSSTSNPPKLLHLCPLARWTVISFWHEIMKMFGIVSLKSVVLAHPSRWPTGLGLGLPCCGGLKFEIPCHLKQGVCLLGQARHTVLG
ncbi:hypothetical protein MTR67_019039 [Solanum verrucosum]|uniref:Uncharacterized protein n=1 Tax=Solanum verrucosum TaxID=315347 RepID=A0AAF0QTI2_SOLVR|nr:hypothetical protein MTR67_019039 [Solanum verrucosum]